MVTKNQKRILKKIGKFTVYTAMTGGAYFLARGAISLLLRKLESKKEANLKSQHEKTKPPARHIHAHGPGTNCED